MSIEFKSKKVNYSVIDTLAFNVQCRLALTFWTMCWGLISSSGIKKNVEINLICLSSHVGDLFHLPVMAVRRQIRCLCMPSAAQNHPGRKNYLPPAVMRPETTLHTVQVRRLSRALGSPRLVQCFRSFGSFWEDRFKSRLCWNEPNTAQTLTTPVRIDPASRNWNLELEVAPAPPRSFGCFHNWPSSLLCRNDKFKSTLSCDTSQQRAT